MKIMEMLGTVQETLGGHKVFGEPVHQDGITLIPVSRVSGGGGGGSGEDEDGGEGSGGGFGLTAQPAGVYVIEDGAARWQPAVDVNKLATTIATVLVVLVVARCRVRSIEARTGA